jgi:hypothetical protein
MAHQEIINTNLTTLPDDLQGVSASFYTNISYGEHADNLFDIFIPNSTNTESLAPLVIFIHGGSFIFGTKEDVYSSNTSWIVSPNEIALLLDAGIAFATIDYRLLPTNDGVIDSLNDSMRALQFIRSQSDEYHIDAENIALYGESAGASTALWLALHDDMADSLSADLVARESTKVQAVVAIETQATLDIRQWESKVFPEWGDLTIENITNSSTLLTQMALDFYGIDSVNEIDSVPYIDDINILSLMDENDPQLFINNNGQYVNPMEFGLWEFYSNYVHSPNHVRALQFEASLIDNYDVLAKYQTDEGLFDNTQSQNAVDFLQNILIDTLLMNAMVHTMDGMLLDNLRIYYFKDGVNTGISTLVEDGDITFPDTSLAFDTVKLSNPTAYTDGILADDAVDILRDIVHLDELVIGSAAWHAADVNNDGVVAADDAVDILRHIVHLDEIDTFDLVDNITGNRISSLDANAIDVGQWSIVANGDVDQSGGFGDAYVMQVDII